MSYSFLLIGEKNTTQWNLTLNECLLPLGNLKTVTEEEAMVALAANDFDLIIVDAGIVLDTAQMVTRITRAKQTRVVVVTASPTWQRAREAFQAGASDYFRKSLNKIDLYLKIEAALKLPLPPRPQ